MPNFQQAMRPGGPTRLMAAINVSPESFYGGSIAAGDTALVAAVRQAEAEGAAMIDLGAMSTAPYKDAFVEESVEAERLARAVAIARKTTSLPISADTQRFTPAEAALAEGADLINDVSALQIAPQIGELVAKRGAGLILMASEYGPIGEPADDPCTTVERLLHEAVGRASEAGVPRSALMVDPGIGFFRSRSRPWHEWDLELLAAPKKWRVEGIPCLVGASRKSLFREVLNRPDPKDRLAGSLAVAAWCASHGVEWLRVHDVAASADVVRMTQLLQANG